MAIVWGNLSIDYLILLIPDANLQVDQTLLVHWSGSFRSQAGRQGHVVVCQFFVKRSPFCDLFSAPFL